MLTTGRKDLRRTLRVVKDDSDNRVLECAVAGRADLIVTGNNELLGLREYRGVGIVRLREFLEDASIKGS